MSSDEFNRCRAAIMLVIVGFGAISFILAYFIDQLRHAVFHH